MPGVDKVGPCIGTGCTPESLVTVPWPQGDPVIKRLDTNIGQGGIMLPSDTYSQPHAADPVLAEQTVLNIVRCHGVYCSAVTSIDETGGEARAYVLDDNLVLKTQRPHRLRPRTSLEKEAFFLQQLAAYPDIVVPRMLGYGRL